MSWSMVHPSFCSGWTVVMQLAGIPSHLTKRMQSVLNSAARFVFSAPRYDRITPLLTQLHWLKVPERIKFKLAVLVYKCLHQTTLLYVK